MRVIGYFNLFGVLALAVLCVAQWQINRRLNLLAIDLDRTRQKQAQKIAEQDRAIKGYMADLDDFRRRLEQSDAALREAEGKVDSLTQERDAAIAARDYLQAEQEKTKAILEKWIAAANQREEALKKANEEIQKLAKDRNDAVTKFNELADKYNGLVKDLNDARAKLAGKN